jgi:uncharacterized membrane protein
MDKLPHAPINIMSRLRGYFFTGILIILPLYISVYILVIVFRFVDGILGNFINVYFQKTLGFYIPGLGILLFFTIIIIAGFLGTSFFGRSLHRAFDRTLSRFPLIKYIYPAVKQAFEMLFSKDHLAFKKAVLVEYPNKGIWSPGFVVNQGFPEAKEKTSLDLITIFIPLSPNPTSGFIILLPRKDVILLDMSINDAMKMVISCGVLNPPEGANNNDSQGKI